MLPNLSHLTYRDYANVYEPAGDTYLLVDGISGDRDTLAARFAAGGGDPLCVEIGAGTATATAVLCRTLQEAGVGRGARFLCTDVNPSAAAAACGTLSLNAVPGDVVLTDLVQALRPSIDGRVDVLVFNPPYVPTPSDEVGGNGIAAAWAGGDRGREVLDRLLPYVHELLSPRGVFYLIAVDENDPDDIAARLAKNGLTTSVLAERRDRNELLMVLKIERGDDDEANVGEAKAGVPTESTAVQSGTNQ